MTQDQNMRMYAIPDGILFYPPLSVNTDTSVKEPKLNLSINEYIENSSNVSDYIELTVFVLYKVFKIREEEQYLSRFIYNFAEYIIHNTHTFGKVNTYSDINNISCTIKSQHPYLDTGCLKEIVYRLWLGDYSSFLRSI